MDKLPMHGPHTHMSPEEVEKWYSKIEEEYNTYLKEYHVKFPKRDSSKALWLVYLKKYEGKLVHKDTISAFVNSVRTDSGKDQQVRHLAAEGWNILNKGDKLPKENKTVPSGYHVLLTTESPKPSFIMKALKRIGRIGAKNFEQLKYAYGCRCATCGSQEGKPHLLEPSLRTKLEQGHMNPLKPLTLDNSIPQCQLCNKVYKDDYEFDAKGRARAVASPRPVMSADDSVKEEIRKALADLPIKTKKTSK